MGRILPLKANSPLNYRHRYRSHHPDREQGRVGNNWNEGLKEIKMLMADMERKRNDILEKLQETVHERFEASNQRISSLEQRVITQTTGRDSTPARPSHPDRRSRASGIPPVPHIRRQTHGLSCVVQLEFAEPSSRSPRSPALWPGAGGPCIYCPQ